MIITKSNTAMITNKIVSNKLQNSLLENFLSVWFDLLLRNLPHHQHHHHHKHHHIISYSHLINAMRSLKSKYKDKYKYSHLINAVSSLKSSLFNLHNLVPAHVQCASSSSSGCSGPLEDFRLVMGTNTWSIWKNILIFRKHNTDKHFDT